MKSLGKISLIIVIICIIGYLINKYGAENAVGKYSMQNDINESTRIVDSALKIMNMDSVKLFVYPLGDNISLNSIIFSGYLVNDNKNYNLYISTQLYKRTKINIIAHELIHVKQFESGDYKIVSKNYYIWKGKLYRYSDHIYDKRPFEIDAELKAKELRKKLNKIFIK